MAFSLASIPAAHKDFVRQACQSIYDGSVGRAKGDFIEPTHLYADGTLSPNGERYAAERLYCSWTVHFDFKQGKVHRVNIQLPDECAGR